MFRLYTLIELILRAFCQYIIATGAIELAGISEGLYGIMVIRPNNTHFAHDFMRQINRGNRVQ